MVYWLYMPKLLTTEGNIRAMKAIIPAAGLGTRFLPATRCMPKELLPVLDKPILQYVVEEALEPEGVDGVVIVNSREKPEIERYFSVDEKFEAMLRERGKGQAADRIHEASTLPVSFVYQDNPRGLGHAVHCAADQIDGKPFFVLLGDYFVPDKQMCVRMAQVSREHNGASVIAVAPVPADQVSRYGIIAGQCVGHLDGVRSGDEDEGAVWKVTGLVEKPKPVHCWPISPLAPHHGTSRNAGSRRWKRDSADGLHAATPC